MDDDALLKRILSEVRTIALVGASARPERPAHGVMRFLMGQGYRVIPVNPGLAGQMLLGAPVAARLQEIAGPVDMVDIFRNSAAVPGIVEAALRMTPRPVVIWTQLGVHAGAARARAEAAGLTVVENRCPKIEHARLGL